MAKTYYKKGRRVFNINEEVNKDLTPYNVVNEKPKVAINKGASQFGSGRFKNVNGGNIPKKSRRIPDIKVLEKGVLQSIIGQDSQVKEIITAIYRSIYFSTLKSNVLIIGNSGTGKTETIKQIAKRLHIPYTIEDATKYTKEGYYGADVNEMVYNLIENANNDIERAQHGIIIIDEIDKKVSGEYESDISGTDVLKSLLKIIEGTTIKVDVSDDRFDEELVDFDTKNLIIIFMGAFSGLEKIRDKRLNTNKLGFNNSNNSKNDSRTKFLKQDLVKFGMPEEFVGRIDTIIEMNKLTKKDLANILRKSDLSIFRRYQKALKEKGIILSYDGKLFELIAEKSMDLDTGARELSNTVNHIFENIIYDVMAYPNKFKKCEISLDIVNDNTKYTLL